MTHRVERLIAGARTLGWAGPPFSMRDLAAVCGLVVEVSNSLPPDIDALITGKRILLSGHMPPTRKRFSLAHEIVHTLLPGDGRNANQAQPWRYRFDSQSPIEQLCQLGASQLLMPRQEMVRAVRERPISVGAIESLARTFRVSLEAMIRRLPPVTEGRTVAVALKMDYKPADRLMREQIALPGLAGDLPQQKLRVVSVGGTWEAPVPFIPRRKSAPDGSVAYSVVESGIAMSADEDWTGVGQLGTCRVHAFRLMEGDYADVLCALQLAATGLS